MVIIRTNLFVYTYKLMSIYTFILVFILIYVYELYVYVKECLDKISKVETLSSVIKSYQFR